MSLKLALKIPRDGALKGVPLPDIVDAERLTGLLLDDPSLKF